MPQTRTCKEEKGQDSNLIRKGRKMVKTFIGAILHIKISRKNVIVNFQKHAGAHI